MTEEEGERHLGMFPPECLSISPNALNSTEITTAFWLFLCGKHVRVIPGSWHWIHIERHTQVEALHHDCLRESRQTQSASSGKSNVTDFTKRHAKKYNLHSFHKVYSCRGGHYRTLVLSWPPLWIRMQLFAFPGDDCVWLDDHGHWPVIARLFSLLI